MSKQNEVDELIKNSFCCLCITTVNSEHSCIDNCEFVKDFKVSLLKLVEEAKPNQENHAPSNEFYNGYDEAIDKYSQNLRDKIMGKESV